MDKIIKENAARTTASKKKVPLKDGLAKSKENPGTAGSVLGTAGTAKPKASEKKVPVKEGRTNISVKFPPPEVMSERGVCSSLLPPPPLRSAATTGQASSVFYASSARP
jgi:hypothetical protein